MFKKIYTVAFAVLMANSLFAQEPILNSSRPSSGDTDVAIVSNIYLYFDLTPTKGTGGFSLKYYDSDAVERTLSDAYVVVTSEYVMLDIGSLSLPNSAHLYVELAAGTLKSADGNTDYSGLGKSNFHFKSI